VVNRRKNWTLVCTSFLIGFLVLVTLGGCGGNDTSDTSQTSQATESSSTTEASTGSSAESTPLKVGILASYTNITPEQSRMVTEGAELAFDEANREAGGRAIEVIKEDTEFDPSVGLTKLRRLVEEEQVDFVIGPISSGVAMAIKDYVSNQDVTLIVPCAFTRQLTTPENAIENIFRVVETTDQGNYPMGEWIFNNTQHRNIVLAAQDYAAGHDSVDAFRAGFEKAGGKIVGEVYTPIGTMDYASYMGDLDVEGADATYVFYGGTDAVGFVQQYDEFGVKENQPLYGYTSIADDPYLPSMGEAAVGVVSSTVYSPSLDTPENRAFVEAYSGAYDEAPSHYSEYGYVAGQMILAVVDSLNGDLGSASNVSNEIMQIASDIVTPSGPLAFDEYRQRIVTERVQKVEMGEDGQVQNVVFDTIGEVAQEDVWGWANQ